MNGCALFHHLDGFPRAYLPCDLLESKLGVIKFNCIEDLIELGQTGIEHWLNKCRNNYVKREVKHCHGNC